jgi:hypothetical protein
VQSQGLDVAIAPSVEWLNFIKKGQPFDDAFLGQPFDDALLGFAPPLFAFSPVDRTLHGP